MNNTKLYTTILSLPDYIATNYGEEFYVHLCSAVSPLAASEAAREAAARAYSNADDPDDPCMVNPDDYFLVACIVGDCDIVMRGDYP